MKKLIAPVFAAAFTGLAALAPVIFASGPATAVEGPAAPDLQDPEIVGTLNRIERYLNGITTIQSRFIQNNPDGSYVEGTMYMSRPGRMRFEYDPPVQTLLVATGTLFILVDKELKQVTHIPLSSTPANFLLREDISFSDELEITAFDRRNGLVRIEVVERDNRDSGSALMTFTEGPMALKQWTITDSQQYRTTVTLIDPVKGLDLDPELFRFFNPWDGRDN